MISYSSYKSLSSLAYNSSFIFIVAPQWSHHIDDSGFKTEDTIVSLKTI